MQKLIDREYNLNSYLENGWKIINIIETKSSKNYILEKKDNPVPSIDKGLINKMCKILLFSDKVIYKGEDITQQIKSLQNGVETDKEEPILTKKEINHILMVVDRYTACDVTLPYGEHKWPKIKKEIESLGFAATLIYADVNINVAVALNQKWLDKHENKR